MLPVPPPIPEAPLAWGLMRGLTWGSEAGSGLTGPPAGACPSLPAPSAGRPSSASVKGTKWEAVIPPMTLLGFHAEPQGKGSPQCTCGDTERAP